MRQWAVGLSGEGYRSGSHYSYLYADWTVDLSLKRRVRILLHERSTARIDGCCPCGVTATMRPDAGTRKTGSKKKAKPKAV
jgi:hypothetical protein